MFARRRPRLETDGADVAFTLLALRRLDSARGYWDRLKMEMMTVKSRSVKSDYFLFKVAFSQNLLVVCTETPN